MRSNFCFRRLLMASLAVPTTTRLKPICFKNVRKRSCRPRSSSTKHRWLALLVLAMDAFETCFCRRRRISSSFPAIIHTTHVKNSAAKHCPSRECERQEECAQHEYFKATRLAYFCQSLGCFASSRDRKGPEPSVIPRQALI